MNSFLDESVFTLNSGEWRALAPYLYLSAGLALATIAAGYRWSRAALRVLATIVLVPFMLALVWDLRVPPQFVFGTSLEVNALTRIAGALVSALALLSAFFTKSTEERDHPEWLLLLLTSVLGMSLLPGTRDWVSFFVALETLSIPAFILVALDTNREKSLQAGLKYLLMGAFASAILLMGIALFYGFSGSLDFEKTREMLSGPSPVGRALAVTAFLLVSVSLAFKVALAPFHMWAADVYQGSPTGVAAFLGTATKVSVFAGLMVMLQLTGAYALPEVVKVLMALSMISVVVGNLVALAQTKIRRMLAYSGVANAGYAGLAMAAGPESMTSVLVALGLYGAALICVLAWTESMISSSGRASHEDVAVSELGELLAPRSAWMVGSFALAIFSIAGLPPLPGFLGKYLLLQDIWRAGHVASAAVLVLGSLLGLAYYLRLFMPLFQAGTSAKSGTRASFGATFAGVLSTILLFAALLGFSRMTQWVEYVEGFAR